jgi:hypothetical protein
VAEIRRGKKQRLGETLQVLRVGEWFVWAFRVPGKGWQTTMFFPAISRDDIVATDSERDALCQSLGDAMVSWRSALRTMIGQSIADEPGELAQGMAGCGPEVA